MFFEATPYVAAVWAEMARRAEVALIASPAGADGEGRLTHCSEVDVGLVGLTVAGSDTVEEGACQE